MNTNEFVAIYNNSLLTPDEMHLMDNIPMDIAVSIYNSQKLAVISQQSEKEMINIIDLITETDISIKPVGNIEFVPTIQEENGNVMFAIIGDVYSLHYNHEEIIIIESEPENKITSFPNDANFVDFLSRYHEIYNNALRGNKIDDKAITELSELIYISKENGFFKIIFP